MYVYDCVFMFGCKGVFKRDVCGVVLILTVCVCKAVCVRMSVGLFF